MKKQQIYLLLIVLIMMVAMPLLNKISNSGTDKPFAGLKMEDIKSINLHLTPPDEGLIIENESDIKIVVETLNRMTASVENTSEFEYTGQTVSYALNKKDSTVMIKICSPYISVDGKVYKANYEVCDVLNLFGNDLLEKSKK